MKGLQIGAQRSDAQPGDVLGHIEPVRADIGHAARRAAGFCIDAPVPVRIVEQPVLEVRSLHDENFAQISGFAHAAHLLHHRIVAQIVTDTVAQSLAERQARPVLRPAQRVVASGFSQSTCLPALKRILGHGKVLRVGRADVDGIDRGIAQYLAVISNDCGNIEARAEALRCICVSAGDGDDLDGFAVGAPLQDARGP